MKFHVSWKKQTPNGFFDSHLPKMITIHHLGGTKEYPKLLRMDDFSENELRKIQREDIEVYGFKDIRFHAIIAPSGVCYLGRPFSFVGAHLYHKNPGNIGILMYGNFEVEKPTKEQINTLLDLLNYIELKYPSVNSRKNIFGHLDFANTLCPGKHMYDIIKKIKYENLTKGD